MYRIGHPYELNLDPERVPAFYKAHWPKRTPLGSAEYYRYLFQQGEEGNPEATIVVLDGEGEILGAMAARRRPFLLVSGQQLTGAEMSTWLVHPKYQALGIGPKILQAFKDRFDALLGCSITPAARDLYARSGFIWRPALHRVIYSPNWILLASVMEGAKLCEKIRRGRESGRTVAGHARPSVQIMGAWPEFAQIDQLGHGFARTREHYAWRYAQNPFFRYRFAITTAADGANLLAVYRVEDVGDIRAVRVVDISIRSENVADVPAFLEALCQAESATVVDFFCSHQRLIAAFSDAPWLRIPEERELCDFPHLLSPPDVRPVTSYSFVFWLSPEHRAGFSEDALLITKQDCDIDRLGVLPNG